MGRAVMQIDLGPGATRHCSSQPTPSPCAWEVARGRLLICSLDDQPSDLLVYEISCARVTRMPQVTIEPMSCPMRRGILKRHH